MATTTQNSAKTGHPAMSEMDLRDYFAASSLQGMVTKITTQEIRDLSDGFRGGALSAKAAYVLADAMLAAREAKS